MPFDILTFTNRLKELFTESPLFPNAPEYYENEWGHRQLYSEKHKDRQPPKLKPAVIQCMADTTLKEQDTITFDIGSESLERMHPYYHILEDAPVIRKKKKGTEKSLGSQAKIEDVGKRDYGRVSFNGKTFSKEYSRNVRGKRNRLDSVDHYITDSRGHVKRVNRESNSYQNVHYRYIERILDSGILYTIAEEQGLKLMRKSNTGLAEEYLMQNDYQQSSLQDIIDSFL